MRIKRLPLRPVGEGGRTLLSRFSIDGVVGTNTQLDFRICLCVIIRAHRSRLSLGDGLSGIVTTHTIDGSVAGAEVGGWQTVYLDTACSITIKGYLFGLHHSRWRLGASGNDCWVDCGRVLLTCSFGGYAKCRVCGDNRLYFEHSIEKGTINWNGRKIRN